MTSGKAQPIYRPYKPIGEEMIRKGVSGSPHYLKYELPLPHYFSGEQEVLAAGRAIQF